MHLKTVSPKFYSNTPIPTLLQETVPEVYLKLSKPRNTRMLKTAVYWNVKTCYEPHCTLKNHCEPAITCCGRENMFKNHCRPVTTHLTWYKLTSCNHKHITCQNKSHIIAGIFNENWMSVQC